MSAFSRRKIPDRRTSIGLEITTLNVLVLDIELLNQTRSRAVLMQSTLEEDQTDKQ